MDIISDVSLNYTTGYIKLFRSIKNKSWYKKSEYVHLWIHLLIKANHRPNKWFYKNKEMEISEGQFVTSRSSLSQETGIKETTIERILNCFKSEQQIEQQNMFTSRLISICKWEDYQISEQPNGQQMDSKWTANGQQMDTNNNVKNVKNVKKEEYIYSQFYDFQLSTAKDERYIQFVKYLFGENKLKQKLAGVLSIQDQLSEEQFVKVLESCEANKKKLGDILTKIENDKKYYKGKKSLYRTLLNWIDDRFIQN